MDTYFVSGEHRGEAAGPTLLTDAEASGTIGHPDEPVPRVANERARLQKAVARALLPSLALWALIWYALTCLIANWP
jgi:hypothetical protein